MKEFKGTPGKFESEVIDMCNGEVHVSILDENSTVIAYCGEDEKAIHNSELFAAAPELLEALQKMYRAGQKQNWNERYESEMNAARAAIAKALGETK